MMTYLNGVLVLILFLANYTIKIDAKNWFPTINGKYLKIKTSETDPTITKIGTHVKHGSLVFKDDSKKWKIHTCDKPYEYCQLAYDATEAEEKLITDYISTHKEEIDKEDYIENGDYNEIKKKKLKLKKKAYQKMLTKVIHNPEEYSKKLFDAIAQDSPDDMQATITEAEANLDPINFVNFFTSHNEENQNALQAIKANDTAVHKEEMTEIIIRTAKKCLPADQEFINLYTCFVGEQ